MTSSKPVLGVNDLQSQFPELAKEWHQTRNSDLKPAEVKSGSNKKVWWQCNKDPEHEWESAIHPKSIGIGCPFCSGKRVLEAFNDLTTTEPQIAKKWHPTRNNDLKPTEVTRGCGKKIW